jgi:hypothetical protein
MSLLDRGALLGLLEALAAELAAMGIQGEMFVVGGATMALAYNTRRATRNIDAVFEPKAVIYDVAGRLASEHGLAPDWLNDAVKGFLPGDDSASTVLFERPGLSVRIASPRYLLAMKVMAARVERDEDDIAVLAKLAGTGTVDAVLDVAQQAYPHLTLPPRVQFLLEELFPGTEPA